MAGKLTFDYSKWDRLELSDDEDPGVRAAGGGGRATDQETASKRLRSAWCPDAVVWRHIAVGGRRRSHAWCSDASGVVRARRSG